AGSGLDRHRDRGGQLARMGHADVDPSGAETLGRERRPARELHAGLRTAGDLDLLPGEVDAGPERLSDRFLRREPAGVVLRRVRLPVAVRLLCGGEAAIAGARPVALERPAGPPDLGPVATQAARGVP